VSATTYPPAQHIFRYLEIEVDTTGEGVAVARIPALPELADPAGAVRLGAIATAIDLAAGSLAVRLMHPDWTATSNLSIRTSAGATGTVTMRCGAIHTGKRSVFMEADIADEHVGSIGVATISFARIRRESHVKDEAGGAPEGRVTGFALPQREHSRGLAEYLGVRSIPLPGAAAVEIELGERVRNSTGVLQGGATAALVEESALRLGSSLLSSTVRLADLELSYLAAGRVGPFRAVGTPIRVDDAHLVCRIEVTDDGAEGRLLAVATGTVLA
jgi:uncharacterized protein (TIGR00369 family)